MRRILLLAAMAVALVLASGVALAATPIACQSGVRCDGTTGDDEMTGASGTNYFYANAGNDTLRGLGSFDDLRGEAGNDILDGGGGNDQYNFYEDNWGIDRISGDSSGSEDWLIFHRSQTAGALTIDLVPSPDRAEVTSGTNKINIASTVVIEWVQGGLDNDIIKGNGADNYLQGRDLNDRLSGRGGGDHLVGDTAVFSDVGDDNLNGGAGQDTLDGGPGNDTLTGGPGQDTLNGGDGSDAFYAQDGEADEINCGEGGDTVVNSDPSLDTQSFDCIDFVDPGL